MVIDPKCSPNNTSTICPAIFPEIMESLVELPMYWLTLIDSTISAFHSKVIPVNVREVKITNNHDP